jgi:hypothetical protein
VRRVLAGGLMLLLTTACAGPDRPLSVDFKEVPSNVVLGTQTSPTPTSTAPPVPTVIVLPPPSVVTLPPPPFEIPPAGRPVAPPAPLPTAAPCPTVDPLEAPALEAPSRITARPASAAYLFRNSGTFEVSGADARRGTFPAVSLRTVSGALEADNGSGFLFTVQEVLGDVTTTTTYLVAVSQPLPTDPAPGLYVYDVTSRGSDGQESVFTPVPSLQLAAFPLVRGAVVEARGADATTGTVMTWTSTVTGKARVDACGTPLDSWVLDLTDGRLISTTQDLAFRATYAVGTQYGGVVLRDAVAFAGTDGDAGVSRSNTATINVEPRPGLQP